MWQIHEICCAFVCAKLNCKVKILACKLMTTSISLGNGRYELQINILILSNLIMK